MKKIKQINNLIIRKDKTEKCVIYDIFGLFVKDCQNLKEAIEFCKNS